MRRRMKVRMWRTRPIPNTPMIRHILRVRLIIRVFKREIQMSRRGLSRFGEGGWDFKE